jgi:hypothetical protein
MDEDNTSYKIALEMETITCIFNLTKPTNLASTPNLSPTTKYCLGVFCKACRTSKQQIQIQSYYYSQIL